LFDKDILNIIIQLNLLNIL